MKQIVFVLACLVLFSNISFSQTNNDLKKREIKTIERLGLDISKFDLENSNEVKDLNSILRLDKKRKTNNTFGIILVSAAALSIIGGIGAKNSVDTGDVLTDQLYGGAGVVAASLIGGIFGGVSIPFWNSSKKRKNERDRLIRIYQEK
ncbi:MAG: hypothetical protein ABFS35_23290 [Bacteroidota bacterium]